MPQLRWGSAPERLESLVASLTEGGAKPSQSNATSLSRDHDQCVARIIEAYGRLDMVVANAGFGVAGTLLKLTNEDYQRQLETNVYGVMNTLRAAIQNSKRAEAAQLLSAA